MTLPVGASVTFTIVAAISPAATGTVANSATATPSAGIVDPAPANNTASDTDTLNPAADLSITKTNMVTSVVPGTAVTYTIAASERRTLRRHRGHGVRHHARFVDFGVVDVCGGRRRQLHRVGHGLDQRHGEPAGRRDRDLHRQWHS